MVFLQCAHISPFSFFFFYADVHINDDDAIARAFTPTGLTRQCKQCKTEAKHTTCRTTETYAHARARTHAKRGGGGRETSTTTHNHTHTHAHCLPPLLVAAARAPTPTPPYTHTHVRVRTPSHDVILAFLFLVLSITQITPFPPYLMLSHIALLLWLCFHIFYTINEKMVQFLDP